MTAGVAVRDTAPFTTIRPVNNRYDMVRYGKVRYGTVRYGTLQYGTVRYGPVSNRYE